MQNYGTLATVGIVVLAIIVTLWIMDARGADIVTPAGVACTAEGQLCPDGSAVGRTGPNCEFAPCPGVGTTTTGGGGGGLPIDSGVDSGVRGVVLLGPTCPVMRDPPEPGCADKPYATTIIVRRASSSSIVATGKSDASGVFELSLPPGSYILLAEGGATLPRCGEVNVTVVAGRYETANISCDTGIR